MYTTIIHPLRKALQLNLTEYCVLESIRTLSHNNKSGGWCIANKKTIAEGIDITDRQVYKIIKKLEKRKIIERNRAGNLRTVDAYNQLFQIDNIRTANFETLIYCLPNEFYNDTEQSSGRVNKVQSEGEQSSVDGEQSSVEGEQSSYYTNNNTNNNTNNYTNTSENKFSGEKINFENDKNSKKIEKKSVPPARKIKKEPDPLFKPFRESFVEKYNQLTETEYYWTVKDSVAINRLIKKIRHAYKTSKINPTDNPTREQMINGFQHILNRAANDKWLSANFETTIIDSKFNNLKNIRNATQSDKDKELFGGLIADILAGNK